MSKVKRAPSLPVIEAQQARLLQMEALQMLLLSMEALGEENVTYETEANGEIECVIIQRCTQQQMNEFIKGELARVERERAQRAAPTAPLT